MGVSVSEWGPITSTPESAVDARLSCQTKPHLGVGKVRSTS
ncbi:hypothetical protein I545_6736 [Mycobacterium kansasii 662]|uniref:Uncharacterized protein n=1 Tax=Mycobacterium kansasii 662 TaxID=1299326 RepID=X7XWV0_MYCKA|nr:hypothetical protein I545_6736 [Mycobacterium kansasii 662]